MILQIRKATISDAESITKILITDGGLNHLSSIPPHVIEEGIADLLEICTQQDDHTVYVAESEPDKIIGYGSVHWMYSLFLTKPEGYVSELFVLENARGKGAGGQILSAMQREAVDRNCARLLVLNNLNRESYRRRFYKKCGWMERGLIRNFVWVVDENTP